MEHRVSLYLLLGGAEARLQSLRPLLGGAPVGVFCDVLRLLHQLWRIHGLHRDDVEGVQILQRGGQTDRQTEGQTDGSGWGGDTRWAAEVFEVWLKNVESLKQVLPSVLSRQTHLLLGGVVDVGERDEAAHVLSVLLENHMIPGKHQEEHLWTEGYNQIINDLLWILQ